MMKLKDSSPMPFGKFKGTEMQKVPATYLDWLHGELGKALADRMLIRKMQADVLDYIEEHRSAIDYELEHA